MTSTAAVQVVVIARGAGYHVLSKVTGKLQNHILFRPQDKQVALKPAEGYTRFHPPLLFMCAYRQYKQQYRGVSRCAARQYRVSRCAAGPRPTAPHWHEPTQRVHYIFIDKQENTCYIHGYLPSAHTPTNFV